MPGLAACFYLFICLFPKCSKFLKITEVLVKTEGAAQAHAPLVALAARELQAVGMPSPGTGRAVGQGDSPRYHGKAAAHGCVPARCLFSHQGSTRAMRPPAGSLSGERHQGTLKHAHPCLCLLPPPSPSAQALLGPSPQPGALHAPIPCYLLNRSCHKPSFLLQNTPLKFLWLAFTLPQPCYPPPPPHSFFSQASNHPLLPPSFLQTPLRCPPQGTRPQYQPSAAACLPCACLPCVWMQWHEATSVQVALLGDQGVGKHSGQCCSQGVVLGKYLVPSISAKQLCWIERLPNEAMRLLIYFYSLKIAVTSVKGADCFTASRKNEHKFCCCVWREETLLIQHPAQ